MTYEEYEQAVLGDLQYGSDSAYVQRLMDEGCIKAAYAEATAVGEMFNWGGISPGTVAGFAYTCDLLYPDLPATWEEYAVTLPGKEERIEAFKEKYKPVDGRLTVPGRGQTPSGTPPDAGA